MALPIDAGMTIKWTRQIPLRQRPRTYTLPLSEVAEGYRYAEEGVGFGRVVMAP